MVFTLGRKGVKVLYKCFFLASMFSILPKNSQVIAICIYRLYISHVIASTFMSLLNFRKSLRMSNERIDMNTDDVRMSKERIDMDIVMMRDTCGIQAGLVTSTTTQHVDRRRQCYPGCVILNVKW